MFHCTGTASHCIHSVHCFHLKLYHTRCTRSNTFPTPEVQDPPGFHTPHPSSTYHEEIPAVARPKAGSVQGNVYVTHYLQKLILFTNFILFTYFAHETHIIYKQTKNIFSLYIVYFSEVCSHIIMIINKTLQT